MPQAEMRGTILALSLVFLSGNRFLARADPCRTDFGGCDKQNGMCWSTGRTTHFCSCKAGYEMTASNACIDVDECEDYSVCPENAECENSIGSYTCTCKCGYVKDYTGQYCLDPRYITGHCEMPLYCIHNNRNSYYHFNAIYKDVAMPFAPFTYIGSNPSQPPAYNYGSCRCEPGFQENTCGYCVDIDECREETPCPHPQATCVNTEGSYYCDCQEGYILGPCGKICYRREEFETIPDVCEEQDFSALTYQPISHETFVKPEKLENFEKCAPGVRPPTTTIQEFDVNHDSETDLTIIWTCSGQNKSTIKSIGAGEARWDEWTCWTACKATCWGGLQTRQRTCIDGVPGIGDCSGCIDGVSGISNCTGCPGAGSEKRECYSGPKCPYRIRKDVETLTDSEKDDLVQAMEKYKADTSSKGFFNAACGHGWPNQCNRRWCCPHGARMTFLSWHRSMILNFEQGLARYLKNESLGVPYWNWLRIDNDPPEFIMNKSYNGQPNPFASMTVRIDLPENQTGRDIERAEPFGDRNRDILNGAKDDWNNVALDYIRPHTMMEFAESTESAHGAPHVAMCPGCRISMSSLAYSSFDPIFMLHHCQIDRLWAVAQKKMDDACNTTWTTQTALEARQNPDSFGRRHNPFNNKSLNAFPIMQAVNNMRDTYYYTELTGVKYDFLGKDGAPELIERVLTAVGGRPLTDGAFIAHYLQNVDVNVKVNYYLPNRAQTDCTEMFYPVATTTIQATNNTYKNTVPRLISVIKELGYEEINIHACYTSDLGCDDRCPEVSTDQISTMPDPALVHYIPGQPIDQYKFDWSAGKKMPSWYISLYSKTQWIKFFGNRASDIIQVSSYLNWKNCITEGGRAVDCYDKPCLLRSGIYRFIDSSEEHCKSGLKMRLFVRY